ncbi:MAG: cytochrome c oxidase accessory protein CcoG [Rhabdaerophilum sp.]
MSAQPLAEDDRDQPLYEASPKVYPQGVTGWFRRLKWTILFVCLGIYYFLPFVRWDRGPHLPNQAVLIDFPASRFYFFFIEIWPQEVYYLTGLLILAALILFLMNAVAGRIWCGYLCPQTVWTDLFLSVERLIEGDRRERMQRDSGKWTLGGFGLKVSKHFIWIMIAWWTGGAWVLYFSDAPTLVKDLASFQAPFAAYLWIGILTFTTYALAGFMREQVCLYMCPWPRIQAALTDQDALNVSYRYDRGEPRMSLKQATRTKALGEPAGDCIDCHQCVAVCPTGVDIREGAQLGCIQCGLCIDACDTVMAKINRPIGLIAYDTDQAIKARACGTTPPPRRLVRARTILYAAVIALVGGLMLYGLATRSMLDLGVIHERTPLFTQLRDGAIRNNFTLRIANKRPEARLVVVSVDGLAGATIELIGARPVLDKPGVVEVGPDTTLEFKLLVTVPRASLDGPKGLIQIKATDTLIGEVRTAQENFFGP